MQNTHPPFDIYCVFHQNLGGFNGFIKQCRPEPFESIDLTFSRDVITLTITSISVLIIVFVVDL